MKRSTRSKPKTPEQQTTRGKRKLSTPDADPEAKTRKTGSKTRSTRSDSVEPSLVGSTKNSPSTSAKTPETPKVSTRKTRNTSPKSTPNSVLVEKNKNKAKPSTPKLNEVPSKTVIKSTPSRQVKPSTPKLNEVTSETIIKSIPSRQAKPSTPKLNEVPSKTGIKTTPSRQAKPSTPKLNEVYSETVVKITPSRLRNKNTVSPNNLEKTEPTASKTKPLTKSIKNVDNVVGKKILAADGLDKLKTDKTRVNVTTKASVPARKSCRQAPCVSDSPSSINAKTSASPTAITTDKPSLDAKSSTSPAGFTGKKRAIDAKSSTLAASITSKKPSITEEKKKVNTQPVTVVKKGKQVAVKAVVKAESVVGQKGAAETGRLSQKKSPRGSTKRERLSSSDEISPISNKTQMKKRCLKKTLPAEVENSEECEIVKLEKSSELKVEKPLKQNGVTPNNTQSRLKKLPDVTNRVEKNIITDVKINKTSQIDNSINKVLSPLKLNGTKRRRSDGSDTEMALVTEPLKKNKVEPVDENSEDSLKGNIQKCDKKLQPEQKPVEVLTKASIEDVIPTMEALDIVSDVENLLIKKGLKPEQALEILTLAYKDDLGDKGVTSRDIYKLVWCILSHYTELRKVSAPRCNKLLRQLLADFCERDDVTSEEKHKICEECVQWAGDKKRNALSHELEVCLMSLYTSTSHWKKAEKTATALFDKAKVIQDKEKMVKACLCLSRVYHAFSNLPKSRAFITTAKTEALKIYTPPTLQAELDLQSGVLQLAEGKDMDTALSYFHEAAVGSPEPPARAKALKYLVLVHVIQGHPARAHKAAETAVHLADVDAGVAAVLAVADAACGVAQFRKARLRHAAHLDADAVVAPQLDVLYSDMLERSVLKAVLPYERVQIAHVAEKVGLPREELEHRLSLMILDGKLLGRLDHRDLCLYLHDKEESDPVYAGALETMSHLGKAVETLAARARRLL